MNEANSAALEQLREEISTSVRELVLKSKADPEERLQILLDLAHSGDTSIEVMREAYEMALKLPDDDSEKLEILNDLLDGIDATLKVIMESPRDAE